jgi:hypothetical protein
MSKIVATMFRLQRPRAAHAFRTDRSKMAKTTILLGGIKTMNSFSLIS